MTKIRIGNQLIEATYVRHLRTYTGNPGDGAGNCDLDLWRTKDGALAECICPDDARFTPCGHYIEPQKFRVRIKDETIEVMETSDDRARRRARDIYVTAHIEELRGAYGGPRYAAGPARILAS